MGIYYSANGSSFTSTLDIRPETFTKYNYDNDDECDLDISYSDFTRVCNLLNSDKKDITAAIIIQRWWRNNKNKLQDKTNKFSIWDFMWFNFI